ncbi:hypothetical protein [Paenibacillus periandrae]|uniref:hypothetical protein n=1 Tax=Paenibacillus periandrae TaxID=1761741 RepID=UPI001F094D17|nr:hypothetical protein [Paenibacillus periandrae]
MSRVNLSIYSNEKPIIGGKGEGIESFLFAKPHSLISLLYFGKDKRVITKSSSIEKWIGEFGSIRLILKENGEHVGVLQLVKIKSRYVISNIYVLMEKRRQRISTTLLHEELSFLNYRVELS